MTPYELGRRDAESGILCVPEMYFMRKAQMGAYVMGYMTVNPVSILAQQLLRQLRLV
jgi:hypothetical protein